MFSISPHRKNSVALHEAGSQDAQYGREAESGAVRLRTGKAGVLDNRMATRGTAQAQANTKEIQVQPGRVMRGVCDRPALPWHQQHL